MNTMEENELKQLLSTTKVTANEKLKDRIVHQINTEKELIPAKRKPSYTSSDSHFSILGIMYALLIALIGYFYLKTDGNPFQSLSFVIWALFISITFSIYWFITVYDDFRNSKNYE